MTPRLALPDDYVAGVRLLPLAALLFDRAVLVHANPVALQRLRAAGLLDRSPDLAQVDLPAALAPGDRHALEAAMREAAAGRAAGPVSLAFPDLDRGTSVSACIFNPLRLASRDHVQVLARDITGRLQAERRLAESEAQFRALFDQSPVAVALADQSRYLLVNDALCRLLGRTRRS